MSHQGKAMVRELIEDIDGVSQTWFELEIEGSSRKKTLVVEVSFDLDPNSAHHLRAACDDIEHTFNSILREENGDRVSKLRIVNRSRSADTGAGQGARKSAPHERPQTN
jgi:hypothetical protein